MQTEMIAVRSSNVESIGYDDDEQTLYIRFKNGTTYRYEQVPRAAYDRLLSAESVGSMVASEIARHYPAIRQEG